jgi:thymidine kinase
MAKLYFRYSAMNAGKSTALLQVAHNYEELGMHVALFTSSLDHRYGVGNIASRLGVTRAAQTYDEHTDFYARLQGRRDAQLDDRQMVEPSMRDFMIGAARELACVLVDEAQFLQPEQVRQLHRLAHVIDLPVICYGIRTDFQGAGFPGALTLLALADDIEELKTICACGRKATMNVRVDDAGHRITEGEQIAIDGTVRYVQTCGRCFYVGPGTTT